MTEIVPIISDLQVPFHDKRAVSAVASWIADLGASRVACVGDVLDSTEVGQWVKGARGEIAGELAKSRDTAMIVMGQLGITDLSRSNHDDRVEKYIAKYAPGLSSLPELTTEEFMGLNELGIKFHRQPSTVAPGWLMMHGDEVGYSRIAGGTALGLARKTGSSVVCGHTHKVGLVHDHSSVNGRVTRKTWGFEVGNLMEQKRASYLGAGYANWQQSVGALVIDGKDVFAIPVIIQGGKLYFEGKTYRG